MSGIRDHKYYQVVSPKGLAERLFILARDCIFGDFMARMDPTPSDRILDIGASDIVNDAANVLERKYPYQHNLTACGLGEGRAFREAFPEVTYFRIAPNVPLPFDANSFDIATSNAVLEHAGSYENQALFVRELCRVAPRVFVSVPNRYFPIEHHTAVPIAHYHDTLFRAICRITGKSEWALEKNLILMTPKLLQQLAAPIERSAAVGYTGLRLGPLSSNLYLSFG